MANTKSRDIFSELVKDVSELKATSRSTSDRMGSIGDTMRSISDTMSVVADTMAATSKSMAEMSVRMRGSERLYERLAKVLLAFKAQTDERFESLEERVQTIESSHRLRSHH